MAERYAAYKPIPELAVHLGLDEKESPAIDGDDLLWLGRIDRQKAPHLASMAAKLLGRHIRIVGPVFDEAYVQQHQGLLCADHVEMVGELGGQPRAAALRDGAVLVYTHARDYVEAGAAVFGESLRAGTPVAALAWRPGTCAEAALCAETGAIALLDPATSDDQAAESLAEAIERAWPRKAAFVQEIGLTRFDPARHFRALAARP